MAIDAQGNVFATERHNHRVVRISPSGEVRVVAGTGRIGKPGPNPGPDLYHPDSIAAAPDGSVFFSEKSGRIRRLRPDGTLEWFAGLGSPINFQTSGLAKEISLPDEISLSVDQLGVLIIAGYSTGRVHRVDPDGRLTSTAFLGDLVAEAVPLRDGRLFVRKLGTGIVTVGTNGQITPIPFLDSFSRGSASMQAGPGNSVLFGTSNSSRLFRWNGEGTATEFLTLSQDANAYRFAYSVAGGTAFDTSTRRISVIRGAASSVYLTAPVRPTLPPDSGPLADAHTAGALFVPNSLNRLVYFRSEKVLEVVPGEVRVLAGGGNAAPTPGLDAKSASLSIAGAALDERGRLIIYDRKDSAGRVFAVDSAGKLADPVAGAPFETSFGSPRFNQNRLAASGGFLYAMTTEGRRIVSYALSNGETKSIDVGYEHQLGPLANGRLITYSRSLFALPRRLENGALGAEALDFELQDQAVRTIMRGSTAFVVGTGLFRRNSDGRWYKLLPNLGVSRTEPGFDQIHSAPDGSLILSDSVGGVLWRVDNPTSCHSRPLPYFPSPGRIVNTASYGDPDTISSNGLATIFAENLDAGFSSSDFYRLGGALLGPPDYPLFGHAYISSIQNQIRLSTFTPFFVSANQASFVVEGGSSPLSRFYVFVDDIRYAYPGPVQTVDAAPGVFVQNAAKDGAAAALNQDGGLNSPANPAQPGSIVTLYANGLGDVSGLVSDTLLTVGAGAKPLLKTEVRIGGQNAEVLYAGYAPALIIGLWQLNVRVPQGLAGPSASVEVIAGGESSASRQNVTISVR